MVKWGPSGAATLMELLVVIGILVVLAGIGPVFFAPIRERVRRSICVSNRHHIHRALMMYVHHYHGVDPPGNGLVLSYSDLGLPPTEPRAAHAHFLLDYLPSRAV